MAILTRSLASAFVDDPVSAFIFPDGDRRETILQEFFAVQLSRTYLPRGEVYTTGDAIGAAMWLPPDSRRPTIGDQLAYLRVSLASGSYRSARRLAVALQRHRPLLAHYYLGTVGVAPAHQRGGLGSALDAAGTRALRRHASRGLPRMLDRAEHPLLRRARIPGHKGDPGAPWWPAALADVAGAGGGGSAGVGRTASVTVRRAEVRAATDPARACARPLRAPGRSGARPSGAGSGRRGSS